MSAELDSLKAELEAAEEAVKALGPLPTVEPQEPFILGPWTVLLADDAMAGEATSEAANALDQSDVREFLALAAASGIYITDLLSSVHRLTFKWSDEPTQLARWAIANHKRRWWHRRGHNPAPELT